MSSALGFSGQIIVPAKNAGASTIVKGQIVKHDPTAAIAFDTSLTGNPVFEVIRVANDDNTAGKGGEALGVLMEDLGPGKVGRVCVWGLVQSISTSIVSVGDVMSTDALGALLDAGGAAHESPCAIAKEAVSAAEAAAFTLKWFFVDFIAGSVHVAASAGDAFYGVSY